MYKHVVLPLSLLTCVPLSMSHASVRTPWDEMDEMFEEMWQQQRAHFAQVKTLLRSGESVEADAVTTGVQVEKTEQGIELSIPLEAALSSKAIVKYNEHADGRVRIFVPLKHGSLTLYLTDRTMQIEQATEENVGTAEHERWKSAYTSTVRSLPMRIDTSSADAVYADGKLRVTFREKQQGTTIAIKNQPVVHHLQEDADIK